MPLTLCTLSLVCSMCSFLYATFFDNHLLRQPTTKYTCISTIRNNNNNYYYYYKKFHETNLVRKKKKNTLRFENIRISFVGLFDWPTLKKKKKSTKKYTSPPLSISSLRPHWRCSHIVGYFCPFTYVHAHTIGKTTMVTMAAMVTRLVWSEYDPTYHRVRWVLFYWKSA